MLLFAKLPELSEVQVDQPEVFLNVAEVRLLQLLKAYIPMLLTPVPIVTDCKPLQCEKALFPMLVTPSPIVTDSKPLQFLKA